MNEDKCVISVTTEQELKNVLAKIFKETGKERSSLETANKVLLDANSNPSITIFYTTNLDWSWIESVWYEGERYCKHMNAEAFLNQKGVIDEQE